MPVVPPTLGEVVEVSPRPIDEVTVLITGFGPWGANTDNPSEHIANALPPSLTIDLPSVPSSTPASPASASPAPISNQPTESFTGPNADPAMATATETATDPSTTTQSKRTLKAHLIIHAPLNVTYKDASTTLPDLLKKHKPDLTLNIGLAAGRTYFAAEYSAPSTGFTSPDADGEVFGQDLPHGPLHTTLSYDSLLESWIDKVSKISVPKNANEEGKVAAPPAPSSSWVPSFLSRAFGSADLKGEARKSDDVGSYLCGFSYHISLTHYLERRKGKEVDRTPPLTPEEEEADKKKSKDGGPVLFLHVPRLPTPAHIALGARVATALVESMVVSFVAQANL